MVSQANIAALEDIIVNQAGPLGKFVIKKTLADMGGDPNTFDPQTTNQFIDQVLQRAIYDQSKWDELRRKIKEAWG